MATVTCVIGVDVGGTNTDAVVLTELGHVLCWSKQPTTPNVTTGIVCALLSVLKKCKSKTEQLNLRQINIGTTRFVNAVVQRSASLLPVAVIRLARPPCTESVKPFSDFPHSLKILVDGGYTYINGGYEFDGREMSPVDPDEVAATVSKFLAKNVKNVVICGVFSSTKHNQEQEVAKIIRSKFGNQVSFTCSYELGQLGLLERENAAILNESLKTLCKTAISGLEQTLKDVGLKCPLFFTQNDGTICSIETALSFPVFTFASGPTNSIRGAAYISGLKDAIVVDIGGTSTDIGVLVNGFPRQAGAKVLVGEVPTNFRMPHTISLPLGGGTKIQLDGTNIVIGPESVGYKLTERALCFNGDTLTATDIVVTAGMVPDIKVNDRMITAVSENQTLTTLRRFREMIENGIDQMKTEAKLVPVVLVGGGSILIDSKERLQGSSETISVEHFSVANAIGAALCQISGQVDAVVAVDPEHPDQRSAFVDQIKRQTIDSAVANGAQRSAVEIVEFDEIPLAYLPGNAIRMKCRAVGPLNSEESQYQLLDLASVDFQDEKRFSAKQFIDETDKEELPVENGQQAKEEKVNKQDGPNMEDHPWVLSTMDVEYVCAGAAILGCGGGGSPHVGKLSVLNVMERGKHPTVVSHSWLLKNGFHGNFPVYSIGFMGAPGVLIEKIPAGVESLNAVNLLHAITGSGDVIGIDLSQEESDVGCRFVDHVIAPPDLPSVARSTGAVMTPEIGGFNSTVALAVSATFDVYCVDCDEMGRAFPELQMSTKLIYGISPFPSVQSSEKSRHTVTVSAESCKAVENLNRKICIENGCSSAFALGKVELEKVDHACVVGSIRRAWSLGKSIFRAKHTKTSPIQAVLDVERGKLICSGKLIDVQRKIVSGFSRGFFVLQGLDEFSDKTFKVEFQNENLVIWLKDDCIACVPDLICLMDTETGEAITTEDLRYGLRATLLVLEPSALLTSEKALRVVGPEAFGYANLKYKPLFAH